jgi:hypothetical protein
VRGPQSRKRRTPPLSHWLDPSDEHGARDKKKEMRIERWKKEQEIWKKKRSKAIF